MTPDRLSVLKEMYDKIAQQRAEQLGIIQDCTESVNDALTGLAITKREAGNVIDADENTRRKLALVKNMLAESEPKSKALADEVDSLTSLQAETKRRRDAECKRLEVCQRKVQDSQAQLESAQKTLSEIEAKRDEIAALIDRHQSISTA